jgi:(p)ppGpp synthase/HD superfamily hydrolase
LRIATLKHDGQFDKQGIPYIEHPKRVAASLSDPGLKIVALLHDTLEDTDCTREELLASGIDPVYVDMISAMTHSKDEPYLDYICRLKETTPEVVPVKLADIRDNLRPGCPPSLRSRYLKALTILEGQEALGMQT